MALNNIKEEEQEKMIEEVSRKYGNSRSRDRLGTGAASPTHSSHLRPQENAIILRPVSGKSNSTRYQDQTQQNSHRNKSKERVP